MQQEAVAIAQIGTDAEVVRKYYRLVRHFALRYDPSYYDDLLQVGLLALLRSARIWRERTGHTAQFWTYARKRVVGEMIRLSTRDTERHAFEVAIGEGEAEDYTASTVQFFAPPDMVLEAREHLSALDDAQAQVVTLHVSGADIRSIAEEAHMGKTTAHKILTVALKNLRDRA